MLQSLVTGGKHSNKNTFIYFLFSILWLHFSAVYTIRFVIVSIVIEMDLML